MTRNENLLSAVSSFEVESQEHQIVERIHTAIMEQRLEAGTKLNEAQLCETFGAGRMRVRRALLLLASQGIVQLQSNRGAFVACPDPDEADDVFGARLAIEPSIARNVAQRATDRDFKKLARHIKLEQQALAAGRRRDVIRLSGEFHVMLASVHGNMVLTRMMQELVARTSLIIGLFGTSGVSSCEEDEHAEILAALRARDVKRVDALTRTHLEHIKSALDLSPVPAEEVDISKILGGD